MTGGGDEFVTDDAELFAVSMEAWGDFVELVESNEPRFLPGLKRLMNRVVPWMIGDIVKPDAQGGACGADEVSQATPCEPFVEREPCACEKYLYPTFELETLGWSWEPITDDDGIHEPDRCLFGVSESEKEDDQ